MPAPHTATGQTSGPERNAEPFAKQRIDRPHAPTEARPPVTGPGTAGTPATIVEHDGAEAAERGDDGWADELLRLHAADLIEQLAKWSAEVDARQSQLNAQQAMLDLERRQFRSWRSSERREIAEQRQSLERQRADALATYRRLAAAEWAAR